jgi:hypothetical protein
VILLSAQIQLLKKTKLQHSKTQQCKEHFAFGNSGQTIHSNFINSFVNKLLKNFVRACIFVMPQHEIYRAEPVGY